MSLENIDITIVERLAPRSGPTSSEDFNASQREIINSFSQIASQWNNVLKPLLDTLPSGSSLVAREDRTANPDPFINGFDGSQVFIDLTSTSVTDDGKFFDTDEERPVTIKEAIQNLESKLDTSIEDVLVEITRVSQTSGITARQKAAIGSRIFNPEQTSSSISLDGLVQKLIAYTNQLEFDVAGDEDFLTGIGVQTLDFSILAQLAAIQAAHDYDSVFNTVTHDNLDMHSHSFHVVPDGVKDGVNKEYTLPSGTFEAGSLQVFVNGVQPQKSIHYAEKGDRTGFDFTGLFDAPISTDAIWIHYIVGS